MAARSTGLFPREGFNLDAEMQVPENVGGTVALLGDVSKAKTVRVIFVDSVITGDAEINLYIEQSGGVFRAYDVNTAGTGVIIDHFRGAVLDGKTQDIAYQTVANTGSVSVGACYLELVDGHRR